MKLITYRNESSEDRIGVVVGERVLDLRANAEHDTSMFASMLDLIEAGDSGLQTARELAASAQANAWIDLANVQLRPPIPLPPRMRAMSCDPLHLQQARAGRTRIIAADAGQSEEQIREAVAALEQFPAQGWYETPIYWFIDRHCVSGPGEVVTWPTYSTWIDYELELGAVIGRRARDLTKEDATACIFGYTIVNDLSARDAQFQATKTGLSITAKGKDFEGSYPMGPCIVTADEFDPSKVTAILRVNGEVWGRGTTAGRHWTFEDGLVYASQHANLIPGEILTSATIGNCAGMEMARRGKRGDVVELEVQGIGTLRTTIA